MSEKYTVSVLYDGERADVFLSAVTGKTRSHVQKAIELSLVKINGKEINSHYRVKAGDIAEYAELPVKSADIKPVDIPLEIVYEDDDIAVINKPQGLTVHAGAGTGDETLVNALLFKLDNLSGINGELRPGIVHRIDKNTSGLLVVAKNDEAHVKLAKQIESKECKRIYVALLEGVVKSDGGRIETKIDRDKKNRTLMAVSSAGRVAITDYKVLQRYKNNTLTEFGLLTGRTHQIRVHAKYIGHPVVGDSEYGYKNQRFKLNGQLLHAEKLILTHPRTGKVMEFTAELPDYFKEVLRKLEKEKI